MRAAPLLACLVFLLAGCGDDATTAAESTTQTTTAATKLGPRCTQGTAVITHTLDDGLKKKRWTLSDVYAVKTTAYGSVFFVSGRIDGAPESPIGTWATNNLNLGGLMFAVDPVAKKLSKYADAAKFDPNLTMKLDGARESRACVRQAGA